ncbi:hypothetical protein [Kitasatospora sp. McL0602]|uniref:hypothetical protein n=1 Tax=Kitasatospora sp. McL0602 TaxID=3439530 RepID=UPI003F8BE634
MTHSPTMSGVPSGLPGTAAPDIPTTVPYDGKDPLSAEAAFGWLPAGVTEIWTAVVSDGHMMQARGAITAAGGPHFNLRVFPAGVSPALTAFPMGLTAVRVAAPQVGGREAYWTVTNDAGYNASLSLLRWRTADGRWAELNASGLDGATKEQVTLQVADGVTVSHRVVPLPFHVSAPPAGFRLSGITLVEPVSGISAVSGGWSLTMNYAAGGSYFSTTVMPDPTPGSTAGPTENSGSKSGDLPSSCKKDQGLQVCVQAELNADVLTPVGGMDGWLKMITLLGTDHSKWTTDVIG